MTYTVEPSTVSGFWTVRDDLGRIIAHYPKRQSANIAAARMNQKIGQGRKPTSAASAAVHALARSEDRG